MLEPDNQAVLVYERRLADGSQNAPDGATRVIVAANLKGDEQSVTLGIEASSAQDLLTGEAYKLNGPLTLKPYQCLWLKLA